MLNTENSKTENTHTNYTHKETDSNRQQEYRKTNTYKKLTTNKILSKLLKHHIKSSVFWHRVSSVFLTEEKYAFTVDHNFVQYVNNCVILEIKFV